MPKRPPLPQEVRQLALDQLRADNSNHTTRGHLIIQASTTLEYCWSFAPDSQPVSPIYLVKVRLHGWDVIQPAIYAIKSVDQTLEINEIKLGDQTISWSRWAIAP